VSRDQCFSPYSPSLTSSILPPTLPPARALPPTPYLYDPRLICMTPAEHKLKATAAQSIGDEEEEEERIEGW
jgi:hypothetical protein